MSLLFVPIWAVDVIGSVLMIVGSILCLHLAHRLQKHTPENVIWTYLLWVCYGLTAFAVSRSAGHILKQILYLTGDTDIWSKIRPFSGAINTFMFVFVASVTLFFERIWNIYQQILKDKQALQSTHGELVYLNQNLEDLVAARSEELMRSEKKYRRIFELSKDILVVTNDNGRILELNPAGKQMLDRHQQDPSSPATELSTYFAHRQEWEDICNRLTKDGFIDSTETVLTVAEDRRIRTILSGALDKGIGSQKDTLHFTIKDVERQRSMQEQMAQADKLASIGQLSAGVAHEINNPLGIILGYTQLLLRNESGQSERRDDLKTIEKHTRHCKSIVENLLNFARTSESQKERVALNDLLAEVLEFVQHHSDLAGVEVETAYDADAPELLLDEKKIRQVFMNLIMNAKHAIGNAGTIHIKTAYAPEAERVSVAIADTGYGISAADLKQIFDPFFTTKPTGEGTGLGLSVSYGIVKAHGGDIHVESRPGHGSTFTVVLPVQ